MSEIVEARVKVLGISVEARKVARFTKPAMLFANYVLLTFFGFIFMFPLIFMIMSSFKPNEQIFEDLQSFDAFLPVGDVSFDNYTDMWERADFVTPMSNSIRIAVLTTIIGLVINSMAAYALARLRWRGQSVVLALIIATLIIPFETIIMPLILIVNDLPWLVFEFPDVSFSISGTPIIDWISITGGTLIIEQGWQNSFHVQIIPPAASAIAIFLFYQFFLDLPLELDEAARVDGASAFRIYWSIVLPLARPVLATVAILTFLGSWNSYLWPILVVQSAEKRPIMPAIEIFFGDTPEWGQVMAFATMVTIPVLIFFYLFQNWFIKSIAGTGLKG